MEDLSFFYTFDIIASEMLEEGNYEVMSAGIYVNMEASGVFISQKQLEEMSECAHLTRDTKSKAKRVLVEIEQYAKEGGEL